MSQQLCSDQAFMWNNCFVWSEYKIWIMLCHLSPPVECPVSPTMATTNLTITNLHKGLRLVFSSLSLSPCNTQSVCAEIGKSKNVKLDFLFRIILCKYKTKCRYLYKYYPREFISIWHSFCWLIRSWHFG